MRRHRSEPLRLPSSAYYYDVPAVMVMNDELMLGTVSASGSHGKRVVSGTWYGYQGMLQRVCGQALSLSQRLSEAARFARLCLCQSLRSSRLASLGAHTARFLRSAHLASHGLPQPGRFAQPTRFARAPTARSLRSPPSLRSGAPPPQVIDITPNCLFLPLGVALNPLNFS